ncbi:MAG TPA: hypothetical protein VEJ67_15730 [Candidatus Cybelea sp.]|nr:hypothetical protein [Candidatus Cybelea sp.]
MAQTLKFDLFVWGYFEAEPEGTMKLHVFCYRAKDAHAIEGLQVPILLTPRMKEMTSMDVEESWHADYPFSGKNGYTYPQCVLCPEAIYSDAAVRVACAPVQRVCGGLAVPLVPNHNPPMQLSYRGTEQR